MTPKDTPCVSALHSGTWFTTRKLLSIILFCSLGFAAVGWCFREVFKSRAHARESACLSNLHYIGVALRNYHEIYGSFPPAYSVDKEGKPSCSWRVLLLAADPAYSYIYNSYNFDQPWNGSTNRNLAVEMPSIYSCPNNDPQQRNWPCTSYVAIVGRGTAFQGSKPLKIDDDQGRQKRTILIAEVAEFGINWMEPRDLDVSQMSFGLHDGTRPSISSNDPGGPGVVFVDGRNERLTQDVTPNALKAMVNISGGEVTKGLR